MARQRKGSSWAAAETGGSLPSQCREAIAHLRVALEQGRPWPVAILEAIAMWTAPEEELRGRRFRYFFQGEAFDLFLLAERLCLEVDGAIPAREKERLLFHGQWPEPLTASEMRRLLGADKHRAYLNFWYGVVVEESLQRAVEEETFKAWRSMGHMGEPMDVEEVAFLRLYGGGRKALLSEFRLAMGYPRRQSTTLSELREFTYWLFKRRVGLWDGARVASDTKRGLEQLACMNGTGEPRGV